MGAANAAISSGPTPSGTPAPAQDARLARYQRLADHLRGKITSNRFEPGRQLPSEAELAKSHDVALGTVRQAVALLVAEGLVERRHGRGTFVARPDFSTSLARFFRVVDAAGQAVRPRGSVRRVRLASAPEEACAALGLKPTGRAENTAINIERHRVVDGAVVLMEDIWLTPNRFDGLADRAPDGFEDLLYPMLERDWGVVIAHAHETFFVERATEAHAPLRVEPSDPIVVIERVASGFDNVPVEWRRSAGNAASFRYRVELR